MTPEQLTESGWLDLVDGWVRCEGGWLQLLRPVVNLSAMAVSGGRRLSSTVGSTRKSVATQDVMRDAYLGRGRGCHPDVTFQPRMAPCLKNF